MVGCKGAGCGVNMEGAVARAPPRVEGAAGAPVAPHARVVCEP